MDLGLENRVAIVTGGGSGIGAETCRSLADSGMQVIAADIDLGKTEGIHANSGNTILARHLDVSSDAGWAALIEETVATHGRLDALINCAGIGFAGSFEDLTLEQWNQLIAVNLTGVFLGCQHSVKAMRSAGNGGSIVNLSSIAGLVGGEDIAGYSASKGGVTMLTKSVALHCGTHAPGVRCNSIHPTYVDSEMLDPVAEQFPSREAMLSAMADQVPAGRVAVPSDISNLILFLVSDLASMITGAQLTVDGGQLAGLPAKHSG